MREAPRVVMCSMWRNDGRRRLEARARHLLGKHYAGALRWVWVVGDSDDDTEVRLRQLAQGHPVEVIRHDTEIEVRDLPSRLRRLSETCQVWFRALRDDEDLVIVHESDLVSPPDVVARLVRLGGGEGAGPGGGAAGWPVIQLHGQEQFYDVWAYRAGGVPFGAYPPYHRVYQPDAPFAVDSFGSVYLLPAAAVRGGVPGLETAVLGICEHVRRAGYLLWVDPTLRIVQPTDLWEA